MNNERAFAAKAATGDVEAFGMLVRRNQSGLRAFLLRLTGGRYALADDLLQDTFLEAHRKIRQFRGDGAFSSWLYRIAYSRFLMELRKRKEENVDDPAGEAIESPAVPIEQRLDLEKALVQITAPERAALTLCYALGYSHNEAAYIMRVPLGTVKSHIASSLSDLTRMLR